MAVNPIVKHRHHKVPRHAGGTDDPSNIVELTVEEHAEAHRVLWETYGKTQDFVAWKMLSGKTEEAEAARLELAKAGYEKFLEDEERYSTWRNNIAEAHKAKRGVKLSEEHKKKISENSGRRGRPCSAAQLAGMNWTGRRHSEETKEKMRQSKLGRKHSEEHNEKIRQASTGRRHTEEAKEKMRQLWVLRKQKKEAQL